MQRSTCPFNLRLPNAKDLIFCDVTLRDGEVTPGVTFTQEEKVALVKKLDAIGMQQIQISFMNMSEEIRESSREICSLGLKMKTELMSNGMKPNRIELIDFLLDCNPDIVHSAFFITKYLNKNWSPAAKQEMKGHIKSVVEHIHAKGKLANISFTDATRAVPMDLLEMAAHAAEVGADRIRLADTTGAVTPEGMHDLVAHCVDVTSKYGTIIGVHCHNDFGLALANTLASIKAGAKLIDVSINGLGDRSGNPATAEIGACLGILYGNECSINLPAMMDISKFTEKLSGCEIPMTKPLVGRYAFSHQQDLHIAEQIHQPLAFQCIQAEEVGNKTEIIFGKLSGPYAIGLKAREAGVEIEEKYHPAILRILAEEAEAAKGVVLGDADFWKAVERAKKETA